jgi:bifunctional DNA-binding transcriptional regulator/antitoxin component of YhaV-PrlF toxin-antitoxin module
MALKNAPVISRLGQRRQVVIPKGICDELRLDVGDFVALERRAGAVLIRPQALVDRDDVLTRAEARAVKRGAKDVASGKVVEWSRYKKTRALDRKSF